METFSADRNDVSVWELKGLVLVDFRRSIRALCRNPSQSSAVSL